MADPTQSCSRSDVRWFTSIRGFKHYKPVETEAGEVLVYESSRAFEPHLWIGTAGDTEHVHIDEAAARRDVLPEGNPLRLTLDVAIERHYQVWKHDPKAWKPGDQCVLCGSPETGLDGDVAYCNGCGARE